MQQTRTRGKTNNLARMLFLMALLSFGTEHRIYAYVDPGSGTLIWQTIVAAFAGLLFYGRRVIQMIKGKRRGE